MRGEVLVEGMTCYEGWADLVILSDGAELEGLADAPDTATDTDRQDLHLFLSSDLLSLSRGQPTFPSSS